MIPRHECPRCRQPASATASRRGHCTACGASLVLIRGADEANVRDYLYGPHALTPSARELASARASER